MGLNIKNERVHQLAREAARVTGKTQTGAIEQALEDLLRQFGSDPVEARVQAKVDLVRPIVAAYVADPGVVGRTIESADDLYDEAGLPR